MRDSINSVSKAIEALRAGRMVILVDDEHRENEGDLVLSAAHATPEAINFMTQYGRGLICLPMTGERLDQLNLPLMTLRNRSSFATAFTVSIEAARGVSTGISAFDRAKTIQVAIDPEAGPDDLVSPGHMFPLRACAGGVLERQGQTEGSIDLMKLAGLPLSAVICEIMNDTGRMCTREELLRFSKEHQLPLLSIQDIINYRIYHECLIEPLVTTRVPLRGYGEFNMTVFSNRLDDAEHFMLHRPSVHTSKPTLVRIHSECLTGDLLGSLKCDCGPQLDLSLKHLAQEGGVLIYLRQEGRGIGLVNKLKAYNLQEDQGLDTVEANEHLGLPIDARNYAIAYQILKRYDHLSVRLMTNNPEKVKALESYGVEVVERVALLAEPTFENEAYLRVKKNKLGHYINES